MFSAPLNLFGCAWVHIYNTTNSKPPVNESNQQNNTNMTLVVLSHWMGALNFQNTGRKWRVVEQGSMMIDDGGTQLEWNKLSTLSLKYGVGLNSRGWIDWWSFISHHFRLSSLLSERSILRSWCAAYVYAWNGRAIVSGSPGPRGVAGRADFSFINTRIGNTPLNWWSWNVLPRVTKVPVHTSESSWAFWKLFNSQWNVNLPKLSPAVLVFVDLRLWLGELGVVGVRSGPGEWTKGDLDGSHTYRSTSM